MIQVAAPVRVRERLSVAPDGPREVVHAGSAAIYINLDGWCLGLVSASATRVPCALWSSLPDLGTLAAALADGPVEVVGGSLVVAGEILRIARLVDVSAPTPQRRAPRGFAHESLTTLDLPDGPLTADHAAHLLGRGPGLTPLGDDVLAGWFAACHAAGRPDHELATVVRPRLGATTLLSATLLDCAIRGETLPQLAAWLADPTESNARALTAVGATSGTGLLAGAELALSSRANHHPAHHPDHHHSPGRAA